MKRTQSLIIIAASLLLVACGSNKTMVRDNAVGGKTAVAGNSQKSTRAGQAMSQLQFMEIVNDRKTGVGNIVSDINFKLTIGDKDISASGALRMRRDTVIRIQLFVPVIGTEVGRLEFTPDYALVVDRIHKQYVKGDYSQLGFMRDNGINFYTLQALFWNELFVPGGKGVGEGDLQKFEVKSDASNTVANISIANGNLKCAWTAAVADGKISEALVTYETATKGNSTLTWEYSDFMPLGAKVFPASEVFTLSSPSVRKARILTVELRLDGFKNKGNWDAGTTLSSKYKQVDIEQVIGKILAM